MKPLQFTGKNIEELSNMYREIDYNCFAAEQKAVKRRLLSIQICA